ncbi:MAG: protein kinase [Acidobacteriota bacterium]|nr:protein kinase [Acidobacteriota bacterium]
MIVIAERDETRRKQMVELIKRETGAATAGVTTARELIWNLKNISMDLVLLNPDLPDINGRTFDLVRKVRASYSKLELPIALLLEDSERDLLLRGYGAGINDVIRLPLDNDVMLAKVRHHLSSRREFKRVLVSYYRDRVTSDPDATVNIEKTNLGSDSGRDRLIPCEIPMNLVADKKPFFCKSIWLTHNSVLLLAFQDIPQDDTFRLRLRNPQGGQIELSVMEIRREMIRDTLVPGNLKLNLRITDAPDDYDDLFQKLQQAYAEHGLSGLPASAEDHDPTGEEEYSSTMVFSHDSSLVKGTRYNFESSLGRGSFASVYLVRDNMLKRNVAMKVLSPHYTRQDKARRNFLNEAQIAAQFHHPNIVFVYEVGELLPRDYKNVLAFPDHILKDHPQRLIYFTMQHVQGETLTNWMGNHGREPVEKYVEILEKILEAMAFAHDKGVTHRDIKPDNIMITQDNKVLVADFGIATLMQTEDGSGYGGTTEVACTPKYASPEQLLGEEMDGRSDLYSFGVLAYEMLAGKAPFGGRTLTEIAKKHIQEKPKPIRKYRKDLDESLERIILKCLEKRADARYQSAEDILKELVGFRGTESDRTGTVMEALANLIDQAIVVNSIEQGARILEKLIAFINLHKTSDNVEVIRAVRSKLSEASLINLLIEKNLNETNFQLLYQFFMSLESSRVVSNLLQWFCRETNPRTKLFLGELAVISSGRDLVPLVTFGLELADHEASLLLKSFSEVNPPTQEPIYLNWSKHTGYQTQMELLKVITVAERPETEVLAILDHYVNAGGTVHPAVGRLADDLLGERLLH